MEDRQMVRPHQTSVMQGKQAYKVGSSEFGVVRPHRTSTNHCDALGRRQFRVSSGWFDHTEPPRTTLLLGEEAVSSEFRVVRPHRTSSNHFAAVITIDTQPRGL